MPGATLPPFPADVRTHPLLVINYGLLKAGDSTECDRFWEAATSVGFWYLKNHGVDQEVNDMFDVGTETMRLPLEEKLKFERGDEGETFGYKRVGANATDAMGQRDNTEDICVLRDDVLNPNLAHGTYPAPIMAAILTVLAPFVCKSAEANDTIFYILNGKLGLPEGAPDRQHSSEEPSTSAAVNIRVPSLTEKPLPDRAMPGAHMDFGSLVSFLHNKLGGLQVMPPGQSEWFYVKPLAGHAICNIDDTLSLFSGGILQSNIHRIVPPPGVQAGNNRWSIVYFTRPTNSKILRALVEDSSLIADAVQKRPDRNFETGSTAGEWISRRLKFRRFNNMKVNWEANPDLRHREQVWVRNISPPHRGDTFGTNCVVGTIWPRIPSYSFVDTPSQQ